MKKVSFINVYKNYGIYILLLALIVLFSVFAKNFFSVDNFINILRQVSMLGIAVVGVTFVMISGGADLSVGGQIAVNGLITAMLMTQLNLPIFPTVLITMVIGTLMGALNGFIAVYLRIVPIIATLGTMLIWQGMASVISGGLAIFGLPEQFKSLGQGYVWIIPIPVIIFIVIAAVSSFVLRKTYFARYLFAMGGNAEAATLAGVNVPKMRILVYALCGFITSIAALIMLSRNNSAQPGAAASYPFDCMTAAVLGGISFTGGEGKISGAIIGVLIIGILNNGLLLMGVDSNWQEVIKGIVLIAAVGLDSLQHRMGKTKHTKAIAS